MRIEPIEPATFIAEVNEPAEYRLRIWTPPGTPGFAWSVDEWDVLEAVDVQQAVDRAVSDAAGRPVELFLKWFDHAMPESGGTERVPRMTRVFGSPGDTGGTVETVYLRDD